MDFIYTPDARREPANSGIDVLVAAVKCLLGLRSPLQVINSNGTLAFGENSFLYHASPLAEPGLFRDGGKLAVLVLDGYAIPPLGANNGESFCPEEKIWPGEDPKEADIKQETNPALYSPSIDPMGGVNFYAAVLNRETNVDITPVIGLAYERVEMFIEVLFIKAYNRTLKAEARRMG